MTPAFDERSAARILDLSHPPRGSRSRALAGFAVILALTAHASPVGGSPESAYAAAMSPAGAKVHPRETAHMKRLMAIGAAAALSAGASAQNAVQWRVEDGGNGHWYAIVVHELGRTWEAAANAAEAGGGHLATLTSLAEHQFAMSLLGTSGPWFAPGLYPDVLNGPWLGARRASLASPWVWVTGEPWSFTAFCSNQPSNQANACVQPETCLYVKLGSECFGSQGWGDITPSGACAPELHGLTASLVEYSADCNNDGLVDFGQIRSGELVDANSNNIPDCCEVGNSCSCPTDTNNDGSVDGIDLATILTRWAQPAAKFPNADCNRDGAIDGADLALVLGSWGACP